MSKYEGVRTVVVGGKSDVRQDYCGVVGGQSAQFSLIDTEIKVLFDEFVFAFAIPPKNCFRYYRQSSLRTTHLRLRTCMSHYSHS